MRSSITALALSFGLLALALPAAAQQPGEITPPPVSQRPTSGEASLLSGRTLGVGEVMVAGAAGWPGLWAQLEIALGSSFNLGIRASLVYGSPFMQLVPGVGGEISAPMRIHLFGQEDIDLAAYVTPTYAIGEAASISGEGGVYTGVLGMGSRLELGALVGWHVQDGLTLLAGVGGYIGFVYTEAVGTAEVIGGATLQVGVEGLISRDTMLFALAEGGLGIVPERGSGALLFGGGVPPILKLSLGVAYLM